MNALIRYQWKGQVRELQNVIERAMIFCDAEFIDVHHLPEYIQKLSGGSDSITAASHLTLKDAVKNFERQLIEKKIGLNPADKDKVAEELGLSLSSLYRKMEELKIPLRPEKTK